MALFLCKEGGLSVAKYEKWLEPDGLLLLEAWARDGLSDAQIAEKCGIQRPTLYEWKKKYPDISDALKRGKEVVDIEVENALLKKALGYTVEIKKTFKVRRVEYENGKKLREEEELVAGYDEVHIPADTVAQKFWLANRKPKTWREKPEDNEGLKELLDTAVKILGGVQHGFDDEATGIPDACESPLELQDGGNTLGEDVP